MFTAIIIDDEPKSRMALRKKLADYCPQVTILAEATSGKEGITLIEQHQPQVVFLDIEMPRMNGFDMLQQIKQKNFHIIFTTAYNKYAIKAVRIAAFDYLLKPVDIEELRSAVQRIETFVSAAEQQNKIDILQHNISDQKKQFSKIAIHTLDGLLFFNIGDIIHLEANSNYTIIYFSNHSKLVASKTLKEFEDLLPSDIFFRIHNSYLINLNYIKKYIKGDGGQVVLTNDAIVDVARRKKEDFMKAIGQ
jgi:two-component system LytT family response regulator